MGNKSSLFDGHVDCDLFPPWFYAEVESGSGEKRVVSLFHVPTPVGNVVYWFDDPETPQRTMPLLSAMKPVNLGDYGEFLRKDNHMSIFIALCKAIEDLPDPLQAVQVIHWIKVRDALKISGNSSLSELVLLALTSLQEAAKKRRLEFEYMMRVISDLGQKSPESPT